MPRYSGRFSRLYVSQTSGGLAAPLDVVGDWTLGMGVDSTDVTGMGDTGKVYVSGVPDSNLQLNGWPTDTPSSTLIAAGQDGLARKVYIYPFPSNAIYFFGTMTFGTEWGANAGGAVTMRGTGTAASSLQAVGF